MVRQMWLPGLEGPNVPLVTSAFVKSIRLRRLEDALGWLTQLWALPSLRQRVTRRILVSSGEDSMSPELILETGRWFGGPHRYSYPHAAQAVLRICQMPSWWALPEGHEMMFAWLRAEALAASRKASSYQTEMASLSAAIQLGDREVGLGVFTRLSLMPEYSNVGLVELLGPHVERGNDPRATALFDCWRGLSPVLGRDTNISGLLLYMLLGGGVPRVNVPKDDALRVQLPAQPVGDEWGGREPPPWANDGIHARGRGQVDQRFAGLLGNFVAMCRAHEHYGRLDPNDPWIPEFYREA